VNSSFVPTTSKVVLKILGKIQGQELLSLAKLNFLFSFFFSRVLHPD